MKLAKATIREMIIFGEVIAAGVNIRRTVAITVGHLTPEKQLSWGQFLEVAVRWQFGQGSGLEGPGKGFWRFNEEIMQILGSTVQQFGESLAGSASAEDFAIVLIDGRWLTWTHESGFYLLPSGDKLRHLGNRTPITTTSLHLIGVWKDALERLRLMRNSPPQIADEECQDAEHACTAASQEVRKAQADSERRGHVCDDASDDRG